jgi:hypothetical protein
MLPLSHCWHFQIRWHSSLVKCSYGHYCQRCTWQSKHGEILISWWKLHQIKARMNEFLKLKWIKIDVKLKGSVLIHFLSCPKLVIIGALDYCIQVHLITHCDKADVYLQECSLCTQFFFFRYVVHSASAIFCDSTDTVDHLPQLFFFLPWNTTNC